MENKWWIIITSETFSKTPWKRRNCEIWGSGILGGITRTQCIDQCIGLIILYFFSHNIPRKQRKETELKRNDEKLLSYSVIDDTAYSNRDHTEKSLRELQTLQNRMVWHFRDVREFSEWRIVSFEKCPSIKGFRGHQITSNFENNQRCDQNSNYNQKQEAKAVNWIRIRRRISYQFDILIPSIDFSIFFTAGHSLSGPKLEKNSNKTCFICSWKNKNSKWNPWKATSRWVLFPLQNMILLRTVKTTTWPFASSL